MVSQNCCVVFHNYGENHGKKMKIHRLAFVDLETTGLDPFRHEIIEIGIVLAEQRADLFGKLFLERIAEHEIRLKPEHIETADPKALEVCKYHERNWENAVAQKEGLQKDQHVARQEQCQFQ